MDRIPDGQYQATGEILGGGWAELVEVRGIEPLAPCLQSRCSPSELHPHSGPGSALGSRISILALCGKARQQNGRGELEIHPGWTILPSGGERLPSLHR